MSSNKNQIKDDYHYLNILYEDYAGSRQRDSGEVSGLFHSLYTRLDCLNLQETDKIIDTVCDLCIAHERLAFIEAVRIGYRLAHELSPFSSTICY